MKRTQFRKAVALLLLGSMMSSTAVSADAAWIGSAEKTEAFFKAWDSQVKNFLAEKQNNKNNKPGQNNKPDKENNTDSAGSSTVIESEMTVVEDATTVQNGEMLRASTYALNSVSGSNAELYASGDSVVYYPVTLYNYNAATINAATHAVEVAEAGEALDELEAWYGMYFNDGAQTRVTYDNKSLYYAPSSIWTNKIFDADTSYYSYSYSYWGGSSWNKLPMNNYGKLALHNNDGNLQVSGTYPENSTVANASVAGYVYTGLVEDTLDANKNIQFTVPDGGLFNTDAEVKDIYTKVGLPFQYTESTHTYTFDSVNSSAKFSGTPASNTNLVSSSDGQFWPFGSSDQWHFGMVATIPFTMTSTGTLSLTSDEEIVFNFAGDDDVWVFIDGMLVLDIGGIHNSSSGSLYFKQNKATVYATDSNLGSGYMNMTEGVVDGEIEKPLFNYTVKNEDETVTEHVGLLKQTLETFAAKDSHELTIFYLERGKGVSNCKISFNLPMKDYVTVHKVADKSITTQGTVSVLTEAEQATVNSLDFGFTLYEVVKEDDTTVNKPVANTNYNLINANGQIISTPATDAFGHFVLKNGQSARFIFDLAAEGSTYYVVEDATSGFSRTVYSYDGKAAGTTSNGTSYSYTANNKNYQNASSIESLTISNPSYTTAPESTKITVYGSDQAEDSLMFICENYLDANLPNPSVLPQDDKIVIDYGLPVQIDTFANDVWRGSARQMKSVTGAKYGTVAFDASTGMITYTLNKQLTGVEVLTYEVEVIDSGNFGSNQYNEYMTGTGTVYIIPATTMYYEEDFKGLISFKGSGWMKKDENGNILGGDIVNTDGTSLYQEPGVVGTVGDSPYGSDIAYLDDSFDSNGTSIHADTTNAAVSFSYTFTGTGTSFYARTSDSSGYMRVEVVNNANNEQVDFLLRNTLYISGTAGTISPDTLYNIPVYSNANLDYGTYTVTVTIFKADSAEDKIALNYHKDFWLDGIRIYKPLSPTDANITVANAAYSTDGEANMTHVTLREKLLSNTDIADDGETIKWKDGGNFVLFTDINNGLTTAEEYKSIGPKEEVYLYGTQDNPQTVTFSLTKWDTNSNKVYLGMKAPTGSANVTVGSTNIALSNTVDCFYDISKYATISTTENGTKNATFTITAGIGDLVSLTTIKVTGDAKFTIVEQKDGVIDNDSGSDDSGSDDGGNE